MVFGTILGQSPMDTNVYLSNDVITVLQLSEGATLEEALLVLGLSSLNGTLVKINVTVGGNVAKAGILLNGITGINGEPCVTDARGSALGLYTGGEASFSISSQEYADISSVSVQVQSDRAHIQYATLALPTPVANIGNYITVNGPANQTIWFSPYVTGVDVHVIDGGRNGDKGSEWRGGGGGNGGNQGYQTNIVPSSTITGNSLIAGNGNGGASSFLGVSGTITGARGGNAGYVDFDDGWTVVNGGDGQNNTIRLFGTGSIIQGGAGGGGGAGGSAAGKSSNPGVGGKPGGGDGADIGGGNGRPGTGPGSGGGGGYGFTDTNVSNGGQGQPGAVYYRWRVESV